MAGCSCWRVLRWAVLLAFGGAVYLSQHVPPSLNLKMAPGGIDHTDHTGDSPLSVVMEVGGGGGTVNGGVGRPGTVCRHAQNSPVQAVDSNGRVCHPTSLQASGCCRIPLAITNETRPFSCVGCTNHKCCSNYARCVACCSGPKHAHDMSAIISARPTARLLLKRLEKPQSQFEWCMLLCRTNSRSTQHQNKFRNPTERHCFGTDLAHLVPTLLK
eukprot:m.357666 g.357666  ORF g.357666 m.357666 type:complete len:215 (+) comp28026_c1_seq20:2150-2794(+)